MCQCVNVLIAFRQDSAAHWHIGILAYWHINKLFLWTYSTTPDGKRQR